ncbi:hypothetical protein AB4K20DRAFT_1922023 [Rhizopus microsporus]
MKGKRAAPTRCITEEIKRKCKQSNEGTEFIYVDEYLTSQICNKCKSRQLNNISIIGSKRRNYDVNSALNINGIFTFRRLTVLPGFNALSTTTVHSLTPR